MKQNELIIVNNMTTPGSNKNITSISALLNNLRRQKHATYNQYKKCHQAQCAKKCRTSRKNETKTRAVPKNNPAKFICSKSTIEIFVLVFLLFTLNTFSHLFLVFLLLTLISVNVDWENWLIDKMAKRQFQ